ncbi:MAG: hypothetical protein RLZZ581_984, partial [Actinomycetota bacterium]
AQAFGFAINSGWLICLGVAVLYLLFTFVYRSDHHI